MASRTQFRIAVIQMQMSDQRDENLARAADFVRQAADNGAQICLLPELFQSLYFGQTEDIRKFDLAEPFPGPSVEAMQKVAREKGVVVVVPFFERRAAGVYHNSLSVVDADGTVLGVYRKMHIPDDPLYLEKYYFAPGDLGFKVFKTKFGNIGTLICWDQWYPEGARITALMGADLLVYPTAIGWHPAEKADQGERQHSAWETVQRGHAVANGIYVAAINRTGHEVIAGDGIEFWGQSFVADPMGAVVAKAAVDREETLLVDCDLRAAEEVRRYWPFLRDRRIDAYQPIVNRFID